MKKISFRVRNFDKEQFLTFNIDNNAELDDDLLDYLEEEEPEGIVPVIFEEGEEFDTFSYDITDKIHLSELSAQEINAEMVLKVLRGLVLSMMNMSEYRIPLSYLVLNRRYIYIDSDYKVEFVCIPLEDMKEEVDLTHFLRNFIASLRFESSENGDYVAKLLTYVNNREMFNLHNMLELVEEWMDRFGIEIPDGESNEIYGEYTEIIEEEADEATGEEASYAEESVVSDGYSGSVDTVDSYTESEAVDAADSGSDSFTDYKEYAVDSYVDDSTVDASENIWESEKKATEESTANEATQEEEVTADISSEAIESADGDTPSEENEAEDISKVEATTADSSETEAEPEKPAKGKDKRPHFKTKNPDEAQSIILEDELDAYLAEKEKEDHLDDIKIKKNIKINRASIVQNTKDELKHSELEEEAAEASSVLEDASEADESLSDKKEKKASKKDNAKKDNAKKEQKEPAKRKSRLRRNKEDVEDEHPTDSDDANIDDAIPETAVEEEQGVEEQSEAVKPAANPIPKVNPYLIRVNTDERIMINKQTFKIGKAGMGVDYTITGNGAISRVHAIITGKDGEYFIRDNKSTNHTFVNGKSVEEGESEKLTNNCRIVLGDEEFIFKEQ